nr:ParB/RepB/Spo0J family partition protein [Myxococcus sp. CA051A]
MPTGNVSEHAAQLLEIDKLSTSPHQKIKRTEAQYKEKADNIRINGLLQPILVRPREDGSGYLIVFGHTRVGAFRILRDAALAEGRATDAAKYERIPCIVRIGLTEAEAATLTVSENMQRNDGTTMEQAAQVAMLRELLSADARTEKDQARMIATQAGLAESRVYRLLRLFDAPQPIRAVVETGRMEYSTALAFMPLWRPLLAHVRPKAEKEALRGKHAEAATSEDNVDGADNDADSSALKGMSKGASRTALRMAKELLSEFIAGALDREWSKVRIEKEVGLKVDRLKGKASPQGSAAASDGEPSDDASAGGAEEKRGDKAAFRDKGNRFIVYPENIETASPDERTQLLKRLEDLCAKIRSQAH